MRKQDEVLEVLTEQPRKAQDGVGEASVLIQALAAKMPEGGRVPLLLLLRPSRRFERMLARELARSRRECGVHCWERLKENLPGELKRTEKGAKS